MKTNYSDMMTKQDQILEKVTVLSVDMATVKEHLKGINGAVQRHQKKLDKQDSEIHGIQKTMWKWGGAIAAIIFILQIALGYVIPRISG